MRRMHVTTIRRWSYYVAMFVGAVLVHQELFSSVVGSGAAGLLRRNSEAYVLMFVPAYWVFRGRRRTQRSRRRVRDRPIVGGSGCVVHSDGAISVALPWVMLSHVDLGLSQAVITLQEGFLGLLVISGYLGVTRSILPPTQHRIDGRAVIRPGPRVLYYIAVGAIAAAVHLDWVPGVVPSAFAEWLQVNIEAYAAMLLIPVYFDVVAVSRTRVIRLLWYSLLVLIPLLVQGGFLDGISPPACWTVPHARLRRSSPQQPCRSTSTCGAALQRH